MYTQELNSGKVRFFEKWKDPLTGKTKTASVVMENGSSRSRKKAAIILQEKIRGTSATNDMTFSELTERFLSAKAEEVKPSTLRTWKHKSKAICDVLEPSVKVEKLSANYIYNCLDKSGYNAQNRNILMAGIKTMLLWSYQHDIILDIGYLQKLKPYKEEIKKDSVKYLEGEELQKVIDAIDRQKWKDLTLFLALTGLRIGEALALTVDDIEGDCIQITKTKDLNGGIIYDTPKTQDSYREIFIQDQLRPLVRKLRRNALTISMVTHNRTIFQTENGLYSYSQYYRVFRTACMDAVGKDLSPHSLRHTHTSLLAEQGIPLEVISRRLGHSRSKITKEVYLHVTQKQKEKDAELLRKIQLI